MWIYCHGISSITLVHGRGKWYANFKTDKFRPGVVFTIFQISSIKRGHVIFTKPSYWITESLGRFFFRGGPQTVLSTENSTIAITIFCIFCFEAVTRGLKVISNNSLKFADVSGITIHMSRPTPLRFLLCSIILSRFHLLKNGREDLKLAGIKDGFQEVENQ